MALPEVYYIIGSDAFFKKEYSPRKEYHLKLATSLPPDNLKDKMLAFNAVGLRLGRKNWGSNNDGILTFNLKLKNPIVIKAQGPISGQSIDTLQFTFAFKGAERDCAVGGMAHTPIFYGVSVNDYLSDDRDVGFSLYIGLARSRGTTANTVVDITSRILRDPAVSGGLIATLPVLGIASAVFEAIRKTFDDSGQAKTIWEETTVQFEGADGPGYPLKAGRYLFASTKESTGNVVDFYRYRGGRLVDIRKRKKNGELKDVEQFYLDIFAS